MFDGNVAVYNLQSNYTHPMYISRETIGKHSNIVWEVKWGADMQDGELNFYSISADGMVYNWLLMQSQLSLTNITALFVDQEISAGPDGSNVKLKGINYLKLTCYLLILYMQTHAIDVHLLYSSGWDMYGIPSENAAHILGWLRRRDHL